MLDACIARVLDSLKAELPGLGEHVALDGSDLPAYANGQRYLSEGGPERERYSDPDRRTQGRAQTPQVRARRMDLCRVGLEARRVEVALPDR
jgi:hypothetical protein